MNYMVCEIKFAGNTQDPSNGATVPVYFATKFIDDFEEVNEARDFLAKYEDSGTHTGLYERIEGNHWKMVANTK